MNQLLYVVEAARSATWTEAAQRLGVSQSALSQGVAEVERRLGVTLFDRRARARSGTTALAVVLPVAERIVALVEDVDRRLDELERGRAGSLRLGMIDTAALGRLATPLARFREGYPGVQTTLVVEPSVELTMKVAAGELDLAVVVTPNSVIDAGADRFVVEAVFDEPIYVYSPSALPAGLPVGRWGPWVAYPSGSQTRRLIEQALRARGADVTAVAESSNPDVLRQMVRLGVGWCCLPREVAEVSTGGEEDSSQVVEGLRRVGDEPLTKRRLSVVRRFDALPNGALDAFLTELSRVS